jgi:GNAT superfamily N-acetyltransferase
VEGVPVTSHTIFRAYSPADRESCLALFDANCPQFFAPNERLDYERFLGSNQPGYEVCLLDGTIVGAFGLIGEGAVRRSLKWILFAPHMRGLGLGSAAVDRVLSAARVAELSLVDIAASQLSEPFFARYGARRVRESKDGWGPGLHRIDMEMRL